MRNGAAVRILVLGALVGCASPPPHHDDVLRVALAREPATWNRLLATDLPTHIVTDRLHAPLIRLNQETQQMEPALAESWEYSADGREIRFRLREGVAFSDGEPFTADDVVFTFRALHDPAVASPLRDAAVIDGTPIFARAVDARTVVFELPRRTAAFERVFDSIRILPEHRLSASLSAGTLAADTGPGAPVEQIVGLGAFRLREHVPGQRIVIERNPYYFRSGDEVYPRLSGIVFDVLPDTNARLLRFRAGELDLLERIQPEAFRKLRRKGAAELALEDLGPGMVSERLWFNLNPASPIGEHKKAWFSDVRFRRAVSLAIDREAMARVVFRGFASAASGPVSPANHVWRDPTLERSIHDVDEARRLLEEAGFGWADGRLVDRGNRAVRFAVITNSGSEQRRREAAFIQEDLKKIGIEMAVTPMDGGALLAKVTGTFDYDACLLGLTQTDPDPAAEAALWMSHAPLHLWHPGQSEPATAWEARIDDLMGSVVTSSNVDRRRASYHEVQRIVSKKLPIIDLVVPHVLIGYRAGLEGLRAVPFSHALWNADELYFDDGQKLPGFQTVTEVTEPIRVQE